LKILHLILDSWLCNYVGETFAQLPDTENRYVAFAAGDAPLQHVHTMKLWRRVGRGYFLSRLAREDLEWSDCLVVHYVEPWGALFMLRAPARVATVWSGWGGDYLALVPEGVRALLGPDTAALMQEVRGRQNRRSLREAARRLMQDGIWRFIDLPLLRAAAARANFFSAPIPGDYQMLRSKLGERFRAGYVQLRYGSNEATHSGLPEQPAGGDILLGNSATPTNNHAEALRMLARLDLGDRKVVVPLSYGDPDYRDAIVELGARLLGARFQPLVKFMPRDEYNACIARCAFVVMNHRRQQALSNISVALISGTRVYLDEAGVSYRFFRDAGAHVFSTRELAEQGVAGVAPLTPEQRAANRAAIASLWSQDGVMRDAQSFIRSVAAWRSAPA